MSHSWKTLLLSGMLLVLTGCSSVAGKWTLQSVTPEAAADRYAVAEMVLRDDGSFCALAKKGGQDVTSTGQYTFENNKLSLTTTEGKTRAYDAKLIALGSKLEVKASHHGEEVTAIMNRVSGSSCGCKSCGASGKKSACGKDCTKPCCADKKE
jgi:hypothetical protein